MNKNTQAKKNAKKNEKKANVKVSRKTDTKAQIAVNAEKRKQRKVVEVAKRTFANSVVMRVNRETNAQAMTETATIDAAIRLAALAKETAQTVTMQQLSELCANELKRAVSANRIRKHIRDHAARRANSIYLAVKVDDKDVLHFSKEFHTRLALLNK